MEVWPRSEKRVRQSSIVFPGLDDAREVLFVGRRDCSWLGQSTVRLETFI